jgi:hypothetical protein
MKLSEMKPGDLLCSYIDENLHYKIIDSVEPEEGRWHCYHFAYTGQYTKGNFYNRDDHPLLETLTALYRVNMREFIQAMVKTLFTTKPNVGTFHEAIIERILVLLRDYHGLIIS